MILRYTWINGVALQTQEKPTTDGQQQEQKAQNTHSACWFLISPNYETANVNSNVNSS